MTHYRKQIRKWHLDKDESVYSRDINKWVAQSSDVLMARGHCVTHSEITSLHQRGFVPEVTNDRNRIASHLWSHLKLTHKACHVESASFMMDFTFSAVCLSCAFSEEISRLIICLCDGYFICFSRSFTVSAMCEVHSSMGKTVKLLCSGEWDPERVPEGTEHLEPLLEATSTQQPKGPDRSFTGKTRLWTFKAQIQQYIVHYEHSLVMLCNEILYCNYQLFLFFKCSFLSLCWMSIIIVTFLKRHSKRF